MSFSLSAPYYLEAHRDIISEFPKNISKDIIKLALNDCCIKKIRP